MMKTRSEQLAAWAAEGAARTKAEADRGRALLAECGAAARKWKVADPYLYITCGRCKKMAPAEVWTAREISGPLPPGQFQCPECGYAFQRREVAPGRTITFGSGETEYLPGRIGLVPCAGRL